jgi:maltose-binding protein MalE
LKARITTLASLLVASAMIGTACGESDESTEADDHTADVAGDGTGDEASDDPGDEAAAPDEGAEGSGESLLIWADELKVEPLEEIAPAFTEETGVEIQVELVPFEDIREQITQAGPAGEGPDVFVGAHDWTGELAANGLIDAVDVSPIEDQLMDVALDGFNFEGRTYALPYATEAIAMYRNTDLVPEAPESFDALGAACDSASAPNCLVMPGGGATIDAYHNYPFVSAYGGYIFAFDDTTGFDPSQVGLDTPEAIQGARYLESQVEAGVVASTDSDTAKNLFLEGEAAFWITGAWELGNVRDQDSVSWDVSLIPAIGDQPAQPFVGAQGFFLSSFSENKLLATSFLLDFLATDDTMQELYDADPRGTAWVAVQKGLDADPQAQVFAESAADGIPMPNVPEMGSVWTPLGDNLLLVRSGELEAEEAMTIAAEAVRTAVAG